jgi:hypothetical protein
LIFMLNDGPICNFSIFRPEMALNRPQCGCLAGAVTSQDRYDTVLADSKRHALQHLNHI